jgi:hypothetical protein
MHDEPAFLDRFWPSSYDKSVSSATFTKELPPWRH